MHAFLTIQFSALIELNREDLTWKQIPALFAVGEDGKGRVNMV